MSHRSFSLLLDAVLLSNASPTTSSDTPSSSCAQQRIPSDQGRHLCHCLLRNMFCAGSSVSRCRLSSGGLEPEPQAKGHELPTFCITKGLGTCHLARGMDTGRKDRSWQPPDFPVPRLQGYKSPGGPLFKVSPWRHQLRLLFYCLVTAPWLNYFKYLDVWDSTIGNLRLNL